MFSRINGTSLPIEVLERFTPEELESFGKSVGTFLSFLHTHKFPVEVLHTIPRADDPFEVAHFTKQDDNSLLLRNALQKQRQSNGLKS